ncbi:AAEL008602-PA [Aedes aegypti]|uniref:AAEL008602-PA n=1 Tax=Aedes aegypti TaxID=7159 RepID=Q16YC1_AEDAE|nr:AAEL008602-PA [Aedes aegypti]
MTQSYRLRCQEVQGVLQARLQDEDHGNSTKSKAQSPIIAEAKKSAPPIQCEVCHKVFIVQRQLADHRRVHRPKNECKWCGKAYVERQRLEKHLKTHENEILEEQERTKSVENVPIAEKIQTVESQEQNVEPSTELEQNKSSENSNNGNTELGSKQVKLETDSASSSFVLDTDVSVRDEEGQDERLSGVDDTIDVEETKIEVRNDEDEADELEPDEVVSYGPGNLPDISEKTQKEDNCQGQQFQCPVCSKMCKSRQSLWCHNKVVHGPKNYPCTVCGFRFVTERDLNYHFRSKRHLKKVQDTHEESVAESTDKDMEQSSTPHEPDSDINGEAKAKIDSAPDEPSINSDKPDSPKLSVNNESLAQEIPDDHPMQDEVVHDHSSNVEQSGNTDNSDSRYVCEKCNPSFNRQCQLKNHMKIHDDESIGVNEAGSSLSEEDDSDYGQRASNNEYFIEGANGELQLQCDLCDRVFQERKRLLDHKRHAHGPKNYPCTVCGKPFVLSEELELHLKSHDDATSQKETEVTSDVRKDDQSSSQLVKTNDQAAQTTGTESEDASKKSEETVTQIRDSSPEPTDVECGECHKKFLNNKYLYNHIRNVHDPKQYLCSYCGKAFLSSQLVQRHQLTHKNDNQPLHCAKCNKSFPTWRKTYMHMRNHAPKKHKCAICSKAYAQPSHLTQHMASHKKKGEVSGTETNSPSLSKNGSEAESSMTLPETVVEDSRNVQPSGSGESKAMQKTVKRKRPRRKTYSCSICSTKFRSNVKLIQHTETSHQEGSKSNEKRSEMDNLAEVDRAGSPKGPLLLFEAEEFKIEPE